MPDEREWNRREILRSAAAGSLASSISYSRVALAPDKNAVDPERIYRENEMPGTRDWMTTNVRIDPKTKSIFGVIDIHASSDGRPGRIIDRVGRFGSPRKESEGTYTATIYPGPRGNIVYNASTIWWADGLSQPPGYVRPAVYTRPQGPDPRVQRITRNLLERMRGA
jgi:hypothetical protein